MQQYGERTEPPFILGISPLMGRWASDVHQDFSSSRAIYLLLTLSFLPPLFGYSSFHSHPSLLTLYWKNQQDPPPSGPRPPGKGTLGTVLRSVGFVQRKKAGICGVGLWHSRVWTTSWSDTYFIWQKSQMSGNKFLLFKKQCSSCDWLGKSSNTE